MKDNDGLLLYKESRESIKRIMIKIFIKILSNPFPSLKINNKKK